MLENMIMCCIKMATLWGGSAIVTVKMLLISTEHPR